MRIHFVHFRKVCVANLGNCLGLMLQSLLKRFFFLPSCFRKTRFELELLSYNFQFLSGLFTEFLEGGQFLFLSSQDLWIVIIVIIMIVFFFIDIGCEEIDFPKINTYDTKW